MLNLFIATRYEVKYFLFMDLSLLNDYGLGIITLISAV